MPDNDLWKVSYGDSFITVHILTSSGASGDKITIRASEIAAVREVSGGLSVHMRNGETSMVVAKHDEFVDLLVGKPANKG